MKRKNPKENTGSNFASEKQGLPKQKTKKSEGEMQLNKILFRSSDSVPKGKEAQKQYQDINQNYTNNKVEISEEDLRQRIYNRGKKMGFLGHKKNAALQIKKEKQLRTITRSNSKFRRVVMEQKQEMTFKNRMILLSKRLKEKRKLSIAGGKKFFPVWVAPLSIFSLLLILLFWVSPKIIERYNKNKVASENAYVELLYNSKEYFLVTEPVVDLFENPDIKSERIGQVLYNSVLQTIENTLQQGFLHVEVKEGLTGYILRNQVTSKAKSAEPNLAEKKVMVTAGSKRIMSHASNGTLLMEVMMGTVLYADYVGENVVRVRLPGNQNGWLGKEGILLLEPNQEVEQTAQIRKIFASSAMSFKGVRYVPHALTQQGADMEGVVYIAARVNGVILPRTMKEQSEIGQKVALPEDLIENEESIADHFASGDLLFFSLKAGEDNIHSMGIVIEGSKVLTKKFYGTELGIIDLKEDSQMRRKIIKARSIF